MHLGTYPDATLTKLRFADDVLLFATSLQQLKNMIADVSRDLTSVGLELHPEITNKTSTTYRKGNHDNNQNTHMPTT